MADWKFIENQLTIGEALKKNNLLIVNETEISLETIAINEPVLELKVEQVVKYPLVSNLLPNQCSFCNKIWENSNSLPRCTRCFRSGYCNTECQTSDWSKHSNSICCKPSDSVGLPFVISVKKSQLYSSDAESVLRQTIKEMCLNSVEVADLDLDKKSSFQIEIVEESATSKPNITKLDKIQVLIDLYEKM
jgi:hypothetical protein